MGTLAAVAGMETAAVAAAGVEVTGNKDGRVGNRKGQGLRAERGEVGGSR